MADGDKAQGSRRATASAGILGRIRQQLACGGYPPPGTANDILINQRILLRFAPATLTTLKILCLVTRRSRFSGASLMLAIVVEYMARRQCSLDVCVVRNCDRTSRQPAPHSPKSWMLRLRSPTASPRVFGTVASPDDAEGKSDPATSGSLFHSWPFPWQRRLGSYDHDIVASPRPHAIARKKRHDDTPLPRRLCGAQRMFLLPTSSHNIT